ncbi:alpha/beta fold hydrolase [Candidatus Viridilinea mediisalina]|uniref:Alpha/beta hydrolase n=1 Tax=Candidatus Viridilinea mediisalina TaxID=2024553 RepID=A0A2A6RGG4_9CHLR|nr:alpha/beta fold hydrolase [Candidatus Viridilinea mediisalina]PDW01950.1 alpha/beta hydrolase [Candidatus Viridilinea mediisalina]
MPTYTINGVRVHAREEGPKTGQICIMIHGWSSSWYALSPLLELVSRRFHCVAIDLPGYGNSERLRERTTIPAYAEVIAKLIQQLSDNPAVLIGHSMGGMTSITTALNYPELVDRMVLLAPTISGKLSNWINYAVAPVTALERFNIAGRIVSALEPSLVAVTDRLMRPASFAERSVISQQEYERLRADARRPGQGRVRAECFIAMQQNDLRGRLSEIQTPSLVIWGAEDNTVPLRDAGVVADEWKGVDLRIVPKAGHWPQFEAPEYTARVVASFLALPVLTTRIDDSISQDVLTAQAAAFLANSDIGSGLTLAQRSRLAAQCRLRFYGPGAMIGPPDEECTDLYIVQQGSIEVWSELKDGTLVPDHILNTVLPGQITGEMALLDGGRRSAGLTAGDEGATILVLRRDRLRALVEDDPVLGNAIIWNIATSLALRIRLANFQRKMLQKEKNFHE